MIKEMLEYVVGLAKISPLVTVGDRFYTTKNLSPVYDPTPEPVEVSTLTALADYLTKNPDHLDLGKLVVHIAGPDVVFLRSVILGEFQKRDCYMRAVVPDRPKFRFGDFIPLESFIIAMQTYFVQSDETANIVKVAGNITDSKVSQYSDDGVTQQVTARKGISLAEKVVAPRQVTLAPYRTFSEVEQPKSQYLLRIKGGDAVSCGLFLADGGSWELDAIQKIAGWLEPVLPKEVVILA